MAEREVEAERFWDARARENALYFVDDRLDYADPDPQRFWAGGEEVLERMLAQVEHRVGPQERVVDLGCGVGRVSRALARRAGEVLALDVSSEMLARARELNPDVENVEWVHGNGRTLAPIEDASVDGCFSHVVFQHLPDPALTLGYVREMGRVLRPGGWAIFGVSTDPAVHRTRATRRPRLRRVLGRGPRGQGDPAWLGSAVGLEALRGAAREGGLTVEALVGPGTQFTVVRLRRGR